MIIQILRFSIQFITNSALKDKKKMSIFRNGGCCDVRKPASTDLYIPDMPPWLINNFTFGYTLNLNKIYTNILMHKLIIFMKNLRYWCLSISRWGNHFCVIFFGLFFISSTIHFNNILLGNLVNDFLNIFKIFFGN